MTEILLVAGGVFLFLILVAFFIIVNSGNKKTGSTILQDQNQTTEADNLVALLNSPAATSSARLNSADGNGYETITLSNVTSLKRPSPERPINQSDAALIDIIRQIPELPSAALELSNMLRDPDANIKRIVALISTDPVLSAKVLRIVNSAAVGRGKISSLQHAVTLLGLNSIWIVVNQILTDKNIQPFTNLPDQTRQLLWRHAGATATCTKHLLLHSGLYSSEEAPSILTSALLHDVGKYLLWGLDPVSNGQENEETEGFSVLAEDGRFGMDHCRMGFLLTTHWRLPEFICSAVSFHHHPSFENWEDIPHHIMRATIIIAISDFIARYSGFFDDKPMAFMIPGEVMAVAGIEREMVEKTVKSLELKHDLARMDALIDAASKEKIR